MVPPVEQLRLPNFALGGIDVSVILKLSVDSLFQRRPLSERPNHSEGAAELSFYSRGHRFVFVQARLDPCFDAAWLPVSVWLILKWEFRRCISFRPCSFRPALHCFFALG